MTKPAEAITHFENDRVIVTEYRFTKGASTGWHRHGGSRDEGRRALFPQGGRGT